MEVNIKDCNKEAGNDVSFQASNDLGGTSSNLGASTGGMLQGIVAPSVLTGTTNLTFGEVEGRLGLIIRFFKRISMFFTHPVADTNYKYNFISRIITTYEDRYWSLIKVNENGQVYFKLFRGWWGRFLYKFGIVRGSDLYWDSVPPRDELASTLGLTHLQIEHMIKKDLEKRASIKNIKELCTTDPDNLKMIAELDKLDKGIQIDDTKQDDGAMMAQTFTVSGSGTYSGPTGGASGPP